MTRTVRASLSGFLKSNRQRCSKLGHARREHAAPVMRRGKRSPIADGCARVSTDALAFGAADVAKTKSPAMVAATAILTIGLNILFPRTSETDMPREHSKRWNVP